MADSNHDLEREAMLGECREVIADLLANYRSAMEAAGYPGQTYAMGRAESVIARLSESGK